MNYLWPIVTGLTFVDVWTLPHLCFWVVVGSSLYPTGLSLWKAVLICVAAALVWEIFEIFAFRQWPDLWHDQESWVNAWLSDPLTAVVAVPSIYWLLARRRRRSQ